MNAAEAKEVLERYRKGDCTAEEARLVEEWYLHLEETGDFEWLKGEKDHYSMMMHENLLRKIEEGRKERGDFAKVVTMKSRWVKWVAAAAIVLIVTSYVLWVTSGRKQVAGDKTQVATTHDVAAPKDTRAVITLADGRKVFLDSVGNGTIAQQNGVSVVKNENGEITYSHEGAKAQSEMQYNVAYNPRGSKVLPLTLNDGTKVWLNSESSLKYPTAFTGNTREVEITGEAYFEVAHDASKPFHVKKGNTDVTVLGTHFNVNAYDDEDALKVTLLEGSVRVGIGNLESGIGKDRQVTIKPGEQAVVGIGNSDLGIRKDIDLDEVMAWKDGLFHFNDTPIEEVMRQVARWYDVEVVYQGTITEPFKGKVPRSVKASELFEMLESTGWVHFRIEGKKVTVSP